MDEVKELKLILEANMKEIKLTQDQVALVDDIDYEYLMQWNWYANWMSKGYRAVRHTPRVNGKLGTIQIHTVIAERMGIDITQIDHVDHNPLNNQRYNLRPATNSQNLHNRGQNKNNKTGVKGVSFHRARGKYQATITVECKQYHLGYFDTIAEAEVVVVAKRKQLVGEFACH